MESGLSIGMVKISVLHRMSSSVVGVVGDKIAVIVFTSHVDMASARRYHDSNQQ